MVQRFIVKIIVGVHNIFATHAKLIHKQLEKLSDPRSEQQVQTKIAAGFNFELNRDASKIWKAKISIRPRATTLPTILGLTFVALRLTRKTISSADWPTL